MKGLAEWLFSNTRATDKSVRANTSSRAAKAMTVGNERAAAHAPFGHGPAAFPEQVGDDAAVANGRMRLTVGHDEVDRQAVTLPLHRAAFDHATEPKRCAWRSLACDDVRRRQEIG